MNLDYRSLTRSIGLIFLAYGVGLLAIQTLSHSPESPQLASIIDGRPAAVTPQSSTAHPKQKLHRDSEALVRPVSHLAGSLHSATESGPSGIDLQVNKGDTNAQSLVLSFVNDSGEKSLQVVVGAWPPINVELPFVSINIDKGTYEQQFGNAKITLIGFPEIGQCKSPIQVAVLPPAPQDVQTTITRYDRDRCLGWEGRAR